MELKNGMRIGIRWDGNDDTLAWGIFLGIAVMEKYKTAKIFLRFKPESYKDNEDEMLVNPDFVHLIRYSPDVKKKEKVKDMRWCKEMVIGPVGPIERGKPKKGAKCPYESWKDARCDGCPYKTPVPKDKEEKKKE